MSSCSPPSSSASASAITSSPTSTVTSASPSPPTSAFPLGKDRFRSFRIAQGSAFEVRAGLRLAVAWGHVEESAIAAGLEQVNALLAMFTGLLR